MFTLSVKSNFPRTDWSGQPPPPLAVAAKSRRALDRIEYAARVASQRWALLANRGRLEYVDPVMYKLAVLDKVFEMYVLDMPLTLTCRNIQRRMSGEERAANYHEWRGIASHFVPQAMALVSLALDRTNVRLETHYPKPGVPLQLKKQKCAHS